MKLTTPFLPAFAMAAMLGACSSTPEDDEATEDELRDSYAEESFERSNASAEESFKYGSIGSDTEGGIPLTVFRVLPRAFPELLPARAERGWSAFGFLEEAGEEVPVGFSIRRYQLINRVGPNCAVCHTGTFRTSESGARSVILGGASQRVDVQGFLRFVAAAAERADFKDRVMAALDERAEEKRDKTWMLKRLLVSKVLLPLTQRGLKKGIDVSWQKNRPAWVRVESIPSTP